MFVFSRARSLSCSRARSLSHSLSNILCSCCSCVCMHHEEIHGRLYLYLSSYIHISFDLHRNLSYPRHVHTWTLLHMYVCGLDLYIYTCMSHVCDRIYTCTCILHHVNYITAIRLYMELACTLSSIYLDWIYSVVFVYHIAFIILRSYTCKWSLPCSRYAKL